LASARATTPDVDDVTAGTFVCPHDGCDKTFAKLAALHRHELTHGAEKVFACHMKTETGEPCDKRYARKSDLEVYTCLFL
jgi:hypothetical protein